jgi:hypothetical protein
VTVPDLDSLIVCADIRSIIGANTDPRGACSVLSNGNPYTVVTDPPWNYKVSTGANGKASDHYDLIDTNAIVDILSGLHSPANPGWLCVYVTVPLLSEFIVAMHLRAPVWEYVTKYEWVKGRLPMSYGYTAGSGMGRVARQDSECLLVFRNHPKAKLYGEPSPSIYVGPRVTEHSVKPVELTATVIERFTPPGGYVIDPFAGSGAIGVAATLVGRNFVGVEIDPDRHAVAVTNLARSRSVAGP